jgi:chromosomal replication initiation ATPase DnaA
MKHMSPQQQRETVVKMFREAFRRTADMDEAAWMLWKVATADRDADVADARTIVAKVAANYGVTMAQIMSRRGHRTVSAARQEAYWRLKNRPVRPLSYPEIASLFGRSDHQAVIYGVRKHEQRIAATRAALVEGGTGGSDRSAA